jgi:hypothetical protein
MVRMTKTAQIIKCNENVDMGLTVYVILHRIVQKNHDRDFITVRPLIGLTLHRSSSEVI